MESKKVFARKYRPQSLNEVKGQEQVVQALKNTILMNRISNAYLFSGTRGVGKTSVARIFSRTLNCQSPSEESSACGNCQACNDILDGRCPDVIEIDGASHNGVDEVRKLQESLNFMPVAVKFKVVIIDEVHMLSKGAFNALLKTVEEPPPHLVFIFATTELHKVPDTIVSRCQQIRFRPISKPQVEKVLEGVLKSEKIDFDSEALSLISDQARGSMRDALSILDFCVVYCQDKLTIQKVEKGLGLVEEKILDQILSLINNPEQENWLGCLNKLGDEVSEKSISAQEFFGTLANRIFHHSLSPGKISINNDKLLLWYQILIKDLSTFQVGFIDSQVQIKMQLLKLARVHFWLSGEENEQSSGIKSISNQKQASFSPQKKKHKT